MIWCRSVFRTISLVMPSTRARAAQNERPANDQRQHMSQQWEPGSAPYHCPVIGADVTIAVSSMPLYGQGQFPIDIVKRMDGCTGNQVCKKFDIPAMFHTRGPHGCPAHDLMNGGDKK